MYGLTRGIAEVGDEQADLGGDRAEGGIDTPLDEDEVRSAVKQFKEVIRLVPKDTVSRQLLEMALQLGEKIRSVPAQDKAKQLLASLSRVRVPAKSKAAVTTGENGNGEAMPLTRLRTEAPARQAPAVSPLTGAFTDHTG